MVGASAAPQSAPFQVSVSYAPSATDPLLVTFFATVVPGQPTLFNWSFGDGQYFNGSGPAYFSPVHHYPLAGGSFVVTVTVHEGVEVNGTSLALTLVPAPFSIAPTASPASGAAPLTVTFEANVAGGTGTYRSLIWSFGNGDQGSGLSVPYTFVTPGHYVVVLNATDSAGVSVTGSVTVNVTGSAPSSSTEDTFETAMIVLGAGLGAALGALAMFLWNRRPPGRRRASAGPASSVVGATLGPKPSVPAAAEVVAPSPNGPASEPRSAVPAPSSPEVFRISQRIVLHLAAQGALGPQEVASIEFTQPGISRSVGVRQNALTNVLRRLVAADVLTVDVRHVRGQPRRLKVYRLTGRGEALARDLRLQRARRSDGTSPTDGGRSGGQ